jgi:hypothetical protein
VIVKLATPAVLVLSLLGAVPATGSITDYFPYASPRPGAQLVAKETTIILRPETPPAGGVPDFPSIEVQGAVSGPHAGESGDGNGENFSYRFTISPKTADWVRGRNRPREVPCCAASSPANMSQMPPSAASRWGGSLPDSFPALTVTVNDNPAPGYVFVGPRSVGGPPYYAAMLDNTGWPAFFRETPGEAFDFKKQTNVGLYSYLESNASAFKVVDENFEFVDTFGPENGYVVLNGHDFQIAPNGNALIIIRDFQPVDMSQVVPGGDPNASVVGLIIQEQDASHNVVFQWRSWDHFEITDALHIDFTAPFVDYVHCNAIEADADGHLLISARNMHEVTKINRQTGEIIWRMGGSNNEFTLAGDTQWFTRQHSVRRTATETVTIFDNGNYSTPQESRAVEYDLDEGNRVATMVWEFRNDPPLYAEWGANTQRLPNGNTVIDWAPLGIITEVRSDGTKAFEMVFDEHWNYRAFRFEWNGVATRPEVWYKAVPYEVTLHFVKFGDPDVALWNVYRGSSPEPTTLVGSTTDNSFVLDVMLYESLFVRVTAADSTGGNESPFSNELHIIAPGPVDAPVIEGFKSRIALHQNRPNPFAPSTIISFALPEGGLVDLTVYDVRGRPVRRLTHEVMVQGLTEVVWDGKDARGRRAGSGVYFYRLETELGVFSRKMLLLR